MGTILGREKYVNYVATSIVGNAPAIEDLL